MPARPRGWPPGWLWAFALLALGLAPAGDLRAEIPTPVDCPAHRVLELVGPTPGPPPPAPAPAPGDYRHRLRSTTQGWPRLDRWCVWVEPASGRGPAARWDQAWLVAVEAALASWAELVPIVRVEQPGQAQVRILRRRPPLRGGRASHGRAELQLAVVQRQGRRQLEPRVLVQISPGQRSSAMQATALHELGHAFGLWGHSEATGDALAAVPGAAPVLELSPRDRATFLWLQQQPGLGPPP